MPKDAKRVILWDLGTVLPGIAVYGDEKRPLETRPRPRFRLKGQAVIGRR